MGSFNYFSLTIQIGSNWYIDTGMRDLQVAFVLKTHNLDMILQLKYMPIVMDPARIASNDWKS